MDAIAAEIAALRKEIDEHSCRYYVLDSPAITDYEYDKLMRRLAELEQAYPELDSADSPTHRVWGQAARRIRKGLRTPVAMQS